MSKLKGQATQPDSLLEIVASLVDRVSILEAKLSESEEAKWAQVAENFNGYNQHLSNIYQRLDRLENVADIGRPETEGTVSRTG